MNTRTEAPFAPLAARMQDLRRRFLAVRSRTMLLCEPLSAEDCCAQSMPDASPAKWHAAHTTWFFETFILAPHEPGFAPFHPQFRMLFNSYYNGVGAKHPRPQRGLLTRPDLAQVFEYRRQIDARILALLDDATAVTKIAPLLELGLHHEQQHQELLLTDVKHLLAQNPMAPAYREMPDVDGNAAPALEWIAHAGGVARIGHDGAGFCFDNELPRHRQFVEPFALAARLVTNGEYAAFIAAGGYRDPSLWLSEGWDWICANGVERPLYWHQTDDGVWREYTLYGMRGLNPHAPVVHVSYFEADAFARWAGARLPSEAEMEVAAGAACEPARDRLHPRVCDANGLAQLFGECWQWTASSYAPYPGYAPAAGAIGEYNGKFMVNQYVLRGSSCVTPLGHARASYRNFFPATARWQFSGIRLARSSS